MDFAGQGTLFDEPGSRENPIAPWEEASLAALYNDAGLDISILPPPTRRLYALSANAFDAVIHARASASPVTAEIARYEQHILTAADMVKPAPRGVFESAQRQAADAAAADRGNPAARIVLDTAYKVWHEIHRLMGLLRFHPDPDGVYIARCEPDHGILPALRPHFKSRFGKTPWAIIDEKRRLCACSWRASIIPLTEMAKSTLPEGAPDGEWEHLWRHYHKTINNESRNNPALQRQFMPKRYWKYLTEFASSIHPT